MIYNSIIGTEPVAFIYNDNNDINKICEIIETEPALKNYIPSIIFTEDARLSFQTIYNLSYFVQNKLLIYLIISESEILLVTRPKDCSIITYFDELLRTLEVYIQNNPMKTTREIASAVNLNKETVRKRLKTLERRKKIKSVKEFKNSQTRWIAHDTNI
jgi:predicted HTH transcriptional regulator